MHLLPRLALVAVLAAGPGLDGGARADEALIAVASNFLPAAHALADRLQAETGHHVALSAGATGKLAAQIAQGAPFDAFLSADAAAPERLEAEGLAVAGSRFTYALGRLVLWSADAGADLADPGTALGRARHVAIASPSLAPYGKAAMECIDNMGLSETVAGKIVTGENIGQATALVASGAAEIGFVAAASTIGQGGATLPLPEDCHGPIRQDAVLLRHGEANAAAKAFLDLLRSAAARPTLAGFGYGTTEGGTAEGGTAEGGTAEGGTAEGG